MPRPAFPSAAAALFAAALAGCGGESPYAAEDAQATEGTGRVPAGTLNKELDPGDAGVVGEGTVSDDADPDLNEAERGGARSDPPGDPLGAKPVNAAQFTAAVADMKGDVVLVDCWATWCGPCREAFPHTVDMGRKLSDRGFRVVTLAFNNEEDRPDVDEFLAEQNAGRLANFVTATDYQGEEWDELGAFSLPTYILYGRDGEEVARIKGTGEEEAGGTRRGDRDGPSPANRRRSAGPLRSSSVFARHRVIRRASVAATHGRSSIGTE